MCTFLTFVKIPALNAQPGRGVLSLSGLVAGVGLLVVAYLGERTHLIMAESGEWSRPRLRLEERQRTPGSGRRKAQRGVRPPGGQ